ncbi:MAG: T9SS type A sorting domain-containing protein [Crocinitomicaceae bacterium]|nr:T9SS type A sorting domain-containing protein [Crocinitomicaceae bacterium]
MKKIIFTLMCLIGMQSAFGQVSFSIVEPASVAGGYNFTSNGDGTNWGLPDLDNPADAIEDTVMLVDDGTPGLNAQGIPLANEGCGTLINDLTGKIAFVYRYDGVSSNVCWYGTKVLMAEQAGAIGVIMVNREDALIDVPGTTDGPLTSIPFAFISKSDGAAIRARLDAGEDVIAFLGNKLGLYANDVGITTQSTVSPKVSATSRLTALDASEFGFDVGTKIFNYGSGNQSNVTVTATVNGPAGTWTETSGTYSLNSGDSIDVFTGGVNDLPAYSQATYPDGRYTLTYDIDLGIPDESGFDNSLSYDFVISDSLISYGSLDSTTNEPVSNANYSANSTVNLEMCTVFENPNASRLDVVGFYFSAVTGYNSGVFLDGEEIALYLYEWNDVFTDLNDPALAFNALNPVSGGFYYYPSDLQDETVYGALNFPVQMMDNQRYLGCVQTVNPDVYFGFDTGIEYNRSIDFTLEAISPIFTDAGEFALGFGTDIIPAMAMKVQAIADIDEIDHVYGEVYPNPATDEMTVSLNQDYGTAQLSIVDLTGRQVHSDILTSSTMQLDVSTLNTGQYLITLEFENGSSTQFKFAKR